MARTHVIIVPSPGMGHLIPLVGFAKRLVRLRPDFDVTCIVPSIGTHSTPIESVLDSLPVPIHHLYLPPVIFDPLPDGNIITLSMSRSAPALREAIESLSQTTPSSAIIFDIFSSEALPSVQHFNIPPYIFFTANATNLSLFFHLEKLGQVVSCEYRDLPEPVQAPGCIPIHGRDLVDLVQDRKSKLYESFHDIMDKLNAVQGILVNSFLEMEQGAIEGLKEQPGIPPVYPIGPLVNEGTNDRAECVRWLDEQARESVVFISLGSSGALSHAQTNELALGLEMSGKHFLWVVRTPNDASASVPSFGDTDPLQFLPQGFMERTKGRGFVVPLWAPQAQVLGHGSTGGFLTHCGWNSILESVVNGVPFIAWPLYAEQTSNALLLSEHLNVALRPKMEPNGIVNREEIARVVKALMEDEQGKCMLKRVEVLKDAANKTLGEGGNSMKAFVELTNKWSDHGNM